MIRVLLSAFLLLSFALPGLAEDRIQSIIIQNNQRIETSTIASYLDVAEGDIFDNDRVNNSLKNLFATGLFADVVIDREGNNLIIHVVENPIINRVVFEGNRRLKDEALSSEVSSKSRDVYTRPKVQRDTKRLQDLYVKSGRYEVDIEPKVIPLDQNRINLVFEINEGHEATIKKINFVGNQKFNSGKLRKIIHSQPTSWLRPWSSRDTYDKERVAYDQELLRRFYLSKGYADFKVNSSTAEITKDKNAFILTFNVEEGRKYQFGDIKLTSQLPDIQTALISDQIKTEKGETFNAQYIEESVTKLTEELNNLGYAFVDVSPRYQPLVDKQIMNIEYQIKEGPTVYIDNIHINGNLRTMDRVVRREMRVSEGDPFNADKIKRSKQRLQNLGFFGGVDVKTTPVEGAPDRADIDITVEERSTGEVNFGVGFSTTEGAIGNTSIRERNLLGKGQDLRLSFQKSARTTQVDLGFTEPYFMGKELSAGFDIFNIAQELTSESGFDSETVGGRLRTGYALTEHIRHSLYYSYRDVDITDVSSGASTFVKRQEGQNINSSIGHSLTLDLRDNRFDPTEGYFATLLQEFAGVGGDSQYIKNELRAGYYTPLIFDELILAVMGRGGHLFGYGNRDIRINERFFVGPNIMRGFDNAGIGPRDLSTTDALGGNIYYAGTTELTFPLGLPDELGLKGAAFVDAGSLFDSDDSGANVADESSLRASAGVGVFWQSPVGPIRIDFAKAFLKESYDEEEIFRINFGARF